MSMIGCVAARGSNEIKRPFWGWRMAWFSHHPALCSLCIFTFILSAPFISGLPQFDVKSLLNDNSDWWSSNCSRAGREIPKILERDPGDSIFQIAGVTLVEDDPFAAPSRKLGEAQIVERDNLQSYRRKQLCYVSEKDARNVHLVFEEGEFDFGVGFYLFQGGSDWNGSNLCIQSAIVSKALATASGLHLGQTYSEVLATLGKPSVKLPEKLMYMFHSKRTVSPEELARLRKAYPLLSDEELRKAYGVYDFEPSIEARFANSKLTYLAVSKARLY